ncbi:4'-phosphopantetheinyl transferase family protein [Aureibacter tunicatorum]|uniref:4'-phosphopantetheinyl transferase n=1 Tax=Aureibacter tunicatorum TaxID=866807 RepID=A0AAE4BQI3_9BACT|nr:4'-phosphopantetheinyl transferase superfamily protein [Aureibacter tunicatorum]MDR6239154.1 4'-phosphopantetheinyl transferase [Aureibacter tunicatorum]BDD04920.1 phosphopantetheine-protein transferase [Aureibacter tunicatorum]
MNQRFTYEDFKVIYCHASQIEGNYELLDGEERSRYERYLSKDKKEEFLKGRAFLKNNLAESLGLSAKSISFSYTKNGKPYLSEIYSPHICHFNLSHTKDYFLLAISTKPIGVDIETLRSVEMDEMIHFLSPQELKSLKSISYEKDRIIQLYKLFTSKEAFIKATDKKYPLEQISFKWSKLNTQWELDSPQVDCQFHSLRITDELEGMVCCLQNT